MTLAEYQRIIVEYQSQIVRLYFDGYITAERSAYLHRKLDEWLEHAKRNGGA
jgi:hypothetical protein